MTDDVKKQVEADNADAAIQSVDGERGIASITSGGNGGLSDKHKKIIASVALVFLGSIAYMSWHRSTEKPPEEPEKHEAPARIKPAQNFQPAEIIDAPAAPVVATATEEQSETTEARRPGPIERSRAKAAQEAAAGPSQAEQLMDSAQRAPLMAYAGTQNNKPASSGDQNSAAQGGGNLSASGSSSKKKDTEPEGLAAALVTTDRDASKAAVLAHPNLTITQGTIIPCALDTAMDSTTPGMVRCTVTDDVYSTTGAVVLLDRGTRIVGEYRGGLKRGAKRLFVIWNRAETPTGVVVNLGSPATDGLGRAGFTGDLDTQFWTRFGGTLMLSVIDTGLVALANQYEDSEDATNNVSQLAETELENTIDVPVILRKNQGEEVAVMVARDLDFSGVYRLK